MNLILLIVLVVLLLVLCPRGPLQRELGLLSQRRIGDGSGYRSDPGTTRQSVD